MWNKSILPAILLIAFSGGASAQNCGPFPWFCPGPPEPPFQRPYPVEPPFQRSYPVEPPSQRSYPVEPTQPRAPASGYERAIDYRYRTMYGPVSGEPFPVPAAPLSEIDPVYLRTVVAYPSSEPPGTIIVDPQNRFLYSVQSGGRAIRYGIGVGRQGFSWSGVATIRTKQEWPDWYPPKEMIQRQPELMKHLTTLQSGYGMAGGPRNPLGARALYLWQGNKDTLYRIHGTIEPTTIGRSVSSGCIRMLNQDAIDLYERTPVGTKVVVLSARLR